MPSSCRELALSAILLAGITHSGTAESYEFEIRAQVHGQGNTLHALGLSGPHVRLVRRRMTQSLQLQLWDLAGTREGLSLFDPKEPSGPKIFFSSYLRLDHDFGSYSNGQLLIDGRMRDAVDVIPEIESSLLELDLLYGYVGVEGLADGWVDLYVGRQMEVQTLDWFSMDGLKLRVHTPDSLVLEAFAGWRVREASWVASSAMTPDGTSSALCEEYVEGAMPGSGAWRPIDGLPGAARGPFTSDDEFCPQRQEWMPTWGVAIATDGLDSIEGRISYRRSQSRTTGLLGASDRLDFEDLGLYPNEIGQAPAWGVNEERIAASLRMPMRLDSKLSLVPYAAARYSLLHGLFDEAHAGLRLAKEAHSLESEVFYSVPTFDGDSIFNIFSAEPYSDARATWHYRPKTQSWGSYSRLWGRRYHSEDNEKVPRGSANAFAGGVQVGANYRIRRDRVLRLDAFHEDGYGGQRSGAYASSQWQWRPTTLFRARLSLVRFDEDLRANLHGYNAGAQLGTTYLINRGFAASLLVEQNSNRLDRFQIGVFGMIDLAFQPET